MGAESITFRIVDGNSGEVQVLQARKNHLGFHINEIPLFLSGSPRYDVSRVNSKLLQLVGDPCADLFFNDIDRLFQSLIYYFHQNRDRDFMRYLPILPYPLNEVGGIVKTQQARRRIEEFATIKKSESLEDFFVTINGPNFPINSERDEIIAWAQKTLGQAANFVYSGELEPDTLFQNHLLIWASAAADGFFTDDDMPEAVEFLEDKFGKFVDNPRAIVLLEQLSTIATLMTWFIGDPGLERFRALCRAAGGLFPVFDRDGNTSY